MSPPDKMKMNGTVHGARELPFSMLIVDFVRSLLGRMYSKHVMRDVLLQYSSFLIRPRLPVVCHLLHILDQDML